MYTDCRESREAFAGRNQEASSPAKGWFMPFRRRRVRSSLQMFAAASLIACSLVLHGCSGGGRATVAAPEGGGPAPTLPPTPTPPPDPTPPQPPPPPRPTQPPPPPPPPQPKNFGIESGDDADAVELILESIHADPALRPYLEGHVLSYDGSTDGVASIRTSLGLPTAGTDFSNASGLTAVWADGITKVFGKKARRGNGAGWAFPSMFAFSNWVDGVFFATAYDYDNETIAPFVFGVPSGVNPVGEDGEGTAVWTGHVAGRKLDLGGSGYLAGDATLTYDFAAANLDATFDNLLSYPAFGALIPVEVSDMSWEDLPVSNGSFGDCSGSGDCIRGRFFDDNEGDAAESVGGVFRHGELRGAFGAERQRP